MSRDTGSPAAGRDGEREGTRSPRGDCLGEVALGGCMAESGTAAGGPSVVGIGGSLRAASTRRTALATALERVAAVGPKTRLIWVRDLDLPFYSAEASIPPAVYQFIDTVYECDALIWSSPTYHGSVSRSFKNVLDWLILLADRQPPYLSDKPVGLVATAGGVHGLHAINSMDFIVGAL